MTALDLKVNMDGAAITSFPYCYAPFFQFATLPMCFLEGLEVGSYQKFKSGFSPN